MDDVVLSGGLIAVLAVWAVAVVALLVDLARAEVRHLPKWAWGLIIAVGSFPIGALIYLVVGRVPKRQRGVVTEPPPPTGPPSPPPPPPGTTLPTPPARSLAVPQQATTAPTDAPTVVATHDLRKVYGDTVALDGVDLAVHRGATYGLIGPNGAGKTTMLSILAGLRRATAGELHLEVDPLRMAVLVDTPQWDPWLTAREVVDLARHMTAPDQDVARVASALEEVRLGDAADRAVGGFSRGMLQRLGLATCLVSDPEVLLLDEPLSALDPAGRREVLDLIGRLAHTKTVILSTHILSDVQEVCDTVGVIDRGVLRFQGSLHQLLGHTSTAFLLHVRAPADGLLETLRSAEWVTEAAEQAPGRIRLVVSDTPAAEREVPRLVASRNLQMVSFHPATDLETAFLELTR